MIIFILFHCPLDGEQFKYHVSFLPVCESILAKAQNFFLYLMRSLWKNLNKVRSVRVFPKVNLRLWEQNAMLAQVVQVVFVRTKTLLDTSKSNI